MRLLLAAALACLTIAARAEAQCIDADSIVAQVKLTMPMAEVLAVLDGERAARFVAAYDALPPASSTPADSVTIVVAPPFPQALVLFTRVGCVIHREVIPLVEVEKLMAGGPPPRGQRLGRAA